MRSMEYFFRMLIPDRKELVRAQYKSVYYVYPVSRSPIVKICERCSFVTHLYSFYSFKTQSALHNKPAYDKSHYQQEMMRIKQAQNQVRNKKKSDLFALFHSALLQLKKKGKS